ncbi:stage II sporulation protein M [Clostridium guangxiense]|uniref:stage II sporulation protein M n=1 Tax=Clostridium guangxiense TaxID=1662055 RepID=UPI001E424FF1|nr:stage II sporulation protein M [Clostridium guangxiense]MCD2345148.1 stage II sporulation protein M [Clostridium guangxiense]
MKRFAIKNVVNTHLKENFLLYILSALCIGIGFVIGVYIVKYMTTSDKSNLISYLADFIKGKNGNSENSKMILFQAIKNNIPLILVVWFLGLTMIGIPIILIIDVLKGFTIGFTVAFFISGFGIKGIGMAMLGVIPQNIIYIPCIIFLSVIAMEFSIKLIKDNSKMSMRRRFFSNIGSYSFMFIIITLIMFMGFFFETYCTPNIIKIIAMNVWVINC